MKNKILLLILMLITATKFNINAQCTFAIPPNAIIINNDTTLGMVNGIYWVCSGDTLNGSGVNNIYFVESGGALDMSGIEKIVYLKSGASINCSGSDDTIYYEAGAIISCSGNHVDILCSQIIFDYTDAPQGGCVITSGIPGPPATVQNITVKPNPFSEKTMLEFYLAKNDRGQITIYDLAGKAVKIFPEQDFTSGSNEISIDASGLQNGFYLLELRYHQGRKIIKLAKN